MTKTPVREKGALLPDRGQDRCQLNLIEKATIMHYHRHRIETFREGTVGALGWRGTASQLRRFEVLVQVGDLSGSSLLDLGCGYGDLKAFLDQRCANFTYIGVDQMPEFIARARERYPAGPETQFYQSDFTTAELPLVDYIMASGVLGYRCANPDFYTDMIRKMYQAARRALAFNMLDADQFPEHPLLVGHHPEEIVAFCKTLSPQVRVIRGYLEDDFTVFVYRQEPDQNSSGPTGVRQ